MNESLYDIPPGCICVGDGLMGVPCDAPVHPRLKAVPITPDDAAVYCPQLGEQFNKGNVFREVDQLSIAVPHPGAAGTYIRIRERLRNGKSRLVFPTLKQFRHWIVGATVVSNSTAKTGGF